MITVRQGRDKKGKYPAAKRAAVFINTMLMIILSGCAGIGENRVHTGDTVLVNYTCRMTDGRVAYTTREDAAAQKDVRASIFLPCAHYGPVELPAGGEGLAPKPGKLREFDKEIAYRLSLALAGLPAGKDSTLTLRSQVIPGLSNEDRSIRIGRIVRFPKERTMSAAKLRKDMGHDPVPGEKVFSYQGITGVVKNIDKDNVHVSISVKDGRSVDHPYGKAVIHDYPDHYELVIEARTGQTVRTLGLVARIAAVDDTTMTLDYSQPFGGENLICDVFVESIIPATSDSAGNIKDKEHTSK